MDSIGVLGVWEGSVKLNRYTKNMQQLNIVLYVCAKEGSSLYVKMFYSCENW